MGLIAVNGAGKSTMFKILTGKELQDTGEVVFRDGIKIGMLDQEPEYKTGVTIREFIYESNPRIQMIKKYEALIAEGDMESDEFKTTFDAIEAPVLSMAQMAELAAEDWPSLQVRLLPSVQWLTCGHNSVAIWRACKEQTEFPGSQPLAEVETCLVWRDQLITRYRSLATDEAAALQGMAVQGWNFAELCGELSGLGEQAPVQAVTWLRQWLSDGLLQRYPTD